MGKRKIKMQAECSSNIDYMKRLKPRSMQLIVTSPPYNIGKEYESHSSMDSYLQRQSEVIKGCVRLLSDKGSICWQVGNHVKRGNLVPLDILLYPLFIEHGLKLRNRIIWHFGHGHHCTKRLSGRHETILWFTKTDDYIFDLDAIRVPAKYPQKKHFKGPNKGHLSGNPKGKNPSDVWDIPNIKSNHCEKTEHPCQFPIALVERLVLALTRKGGNVFDPYLGSGTSVLAAAKNGRNGYGCDVSKKYIQIAQERISELEMGKLKVRPIDKPIYNPALVNGGH